MPREINSRIADHLVSTAVASLDSPRGSKVVCTRRALDAALLAVAREAHEIGFLAGQQQRYADAADARPGSPARPAWMDIPLDHWRELARHGIRIKPVVVQSLAAAGYRRLGDLRCVPERQLIGLHYVGIKTARALRATVQRFEAAEPSFRERRAARAARASHRRPRIADVTTDHLFFPPDGSEIGHCFHPPLPAPAKEGTKSCVS